MRPWPTLLIIVGACACSSTITGTVDAGSDAADVPVLDVVIVDDRPAPMEAAIDTGPPPTPMDAGPPPTPVERCPVAPSALPALPEPTVASLTIDQLGECAVLRDGTARCRGTNSSGELGLGVITSKSTAPRAVVGLTDVRQIVFSFGTRMSVQGDGSLWAWGVESLLGMTGPDYCNPSRCSLAPHPVPGIDRVVSVAMSQTGACALRDDRTVWCWGLTMGLTPASSQRPVLADDRRDVTEVLSVFSHVILRRADGTLVNRDTAERFGASIPPDWTIAPGSGPHLCATLPDLTVRCWGQNTRGQLGSDRVNDVEVREPRQNPGLDCVRAVSRGFLNTCALRTDGTVWCWGSNQYGESGAPAGESEACPDGSGRQCVRRPRRVEGIDHVDSIVSGSARTCAIRSDRSVWCWGDAIGSFAIGSPVPVQNDWR